MEIFEESPCRFVIPRHGQMRVPGVVFATRALIPDLAEDRALQQVVNVAALPGIVVASYAMPDVHWGYGFPIGGVAATDIAQGGVVSPGASIGTSSDVLTGVTGGGAFFSTCHGAGRVMSRHHAARSITGPQLRQRLERQGIVVRGGSARARRRSPGSVQGRDPGRRGCRGRRVVPRGRQARPARCRQGLTLPVAGVIRRPSRRRTIGPPRPPRSATRAVTPLWRRTDDLHRLPAASDMPRSTPPSPAAAPSPRPGPGNRRPAGRSPHPPRPPADPHRSPRSRAALESAAHGRPRRPRNCPPGRALLRPGTVRVSPPTPRHADQRYAELPGVPGLSGHGASRGRVCSGIVGCSPHQVVHHLVLQLLQLRADPDR